MKFICLDGKEIKIKLSPSKNKIGRIFRSDLQNKTAKALVDKYPYAQILEDFNIPRSKMSVDFFMPIQKIVIEVNPVNSGHTEYTPLFHGQIGEGKFLAQKKRDASKEYWAELNGFDFIIVTKEEDLKLL